ncbi:hypothetical protein AAF712_000368 [Marasmius tenuissimus]|uniref:MACPF domain-containing protein n=1 Tax=Marasmius tenuissimus TaxID=585030 RepID=A0ABR3AGC4_9AGAR|nr:hypothetical protein PM082_001167 [Marasmius tenuissimus]
MADFPPLNRLGYGLDFLTVTPLSIKAVDESIKRGRKIIDYDPDWRVRKVKLGDQTYNVPGNIGVSTDLSNFQGSFLTYRSGSEAYNAFKADASLSIKYMCVSGGVSASYATEKTLRRENQHAFYSFNADLYSASLRDYVDSINESALKKRIADLPKPFNGSNKDHEKKYRDFFAQFGTHVINYCTYGARCQLVRLFQLSPKEKEILLVLLQNVWASNSESSVNKRFSASVTASYNGVFAGGQFDASVKKEDQFKEFMEFKQADVTAQGGELNAGINFIQHPDNMEAYDAWGKTVASYPNVTSLSTIEIWSLLRDAAAEELRNAADQLEAAFNHLKSHKEVHQTKVTLTIESDWAEFGLLTPSAVIIKDGDIPANTIFSETKVQWGKEYSHDYHRQDIKFIIVNDGSPIDFAISHGSNGGAPGRGTAKIVTQQGVWENTGTTDDVWNTKWYYQKPVNPQAEETRLTAAPKARIWQDTLTDYLHEVDHYEGASPVAR